MKMAGGRHRRLVCSELDGIDPNQLACSLERCLHLDAAAIPRQHARSRNLSKDLLNLFSNHDRPLYYCGDPPPFLPSMHGSTYTMKTAICQTAAPSRDAFYWMHPF